MIFYREAELILRSVRKDSNPWHLLEEWESFVKSVIDGYQFCIYEYDNDISVRKDIELILVDEQLKQYEEYDTFAKTVERIDENFKQILSGNFLRDDRVTWWEARIPMNATGVLAQDFKENYGIDLSSNNV